jgi:hypothetical protein
VIYKLIPKFATIRDVVPVSALPDSGCTSGDRASRAYGPCRVATVGGSDEPIKSRNSLACPETCGHGQSHGL